MFRKLLIAIQLLKVTDEDGSNVADDPNNKPLRMEDSSANAIQHYVDCICFSDFIVVHPYLIQGLIKIQLSL